MNTELKNAFIIHVCKYLGIALVAGSIVHAGTLGGSTYKYIGLIIAGIILTVIGNYLEYKTKNIRVGIRLLLLAITLSFGTGMLSGGIQHYSDNPAYGSILLSFGLVITFVSLGYKDFREVVSKKSLLIIMISSIVLYFSLSYLGRVFIHNMSSTNHHALETPTDTSMNNMMSDMTHAMQSKTGHDLEKVFLEEMITHHQGAVDMAYLLLEDKNVKPELKAFAQKIISAQNPEIEQMRAWLKNY